MLHPMQVSQSLLLAGMLIAAASASRADEVTYEEKDGIKYQVTRRVISRPIVETRMEQKEQTVPCQKYTTNYEAKEQRYMAPVTEYQWQPEWITPWNPFSAPYVTYRWVPTTRWVEKTQTVNVPVVRTEVEHKKYTVNVPVQTQRVAQEEYISRVAIGTTSQSQQGTLAQPSSDPFARDADSSVARREPIGGVHKMESDPPRGSWRAAGSNSR